MKIVEIFSPLPLSPTPEMVGRAKQFVLRKWQDRAQERGHTELPGDLSSACKFASLFAQRIFGGQLHGNWDHQYLLLPNGQRLDLTEPSHNLAAIQAAGRDPYRHDRRFWNNREHRESMVSCEPRVNQWVSEFLAEIAVHEAVEPRLTLYHGTTPDAAQSLVQRGWQPNQWGRGGNMGQTRYLYLTTGIEDAEWFANEKGAGTVVEVRNVPLSYLIPDPEDATGDTVEDELASSARIGFPAKLALVKPLGPQHFRIVK